MSTCCALAECSASLPRTRRVLQLDHTEREVSAPVDLLGVFRAHEVGATTTFAGALQITKNVAVQVGGGSLAKGL